MPEPFVTQAEEDTGAVPLADSNQGSSQNLPISGYMVTASLAEEVPEHRGGVPRGDPQGQAVAAIEPGRRRAGHGEVRGHAAEDSGDRERPGVPDPQNAVLLGRLANLMLGFGMLQQAYDVNQMIVK